MHCVMSISSLAIREAKPSLGPIRPGASRSSGFRLGLFPFSRIAVQHSPFIGSHSNGNSGLLMTRWNPQSSVFF